MTVPDQDFVTMIREKYKDRRICIAHPSPELTDYRFNGSLLELVTQNSCMFNLGLTNAVSSRIAVNRNQCVEYARQLKATDILWLDSDVKFPINGLLRLISHDKDIVCATASRRNTDRSPIGIPVHDNMVEKLVSMKLVGFPFMLTKMHVFDKMEQPYFAEPPRRLVPELDIMQDQLVGEDEYFCHYARKAGFDIWCDMELSLEIGHIGTNVLYIGQQYVQPLPAKVDLVLEDATQNEVVADAPADTEPKTDYQQSA